MKKILAACFGTTKKAILSSACIAAAAAAIGGGAAYAANTSNASAPVSVIGEDLAQHYAFADAGIDPAAAEKLTTTYDEEDGQFVYEVEFTADDTEYEYWVKASDGTIIRKSVDIVTLDENNADSETATEITGEAETVSTADTTATAEISIEDAKEIALADANVAAADATFVKAKQDTDDGTAVFDIEFYTDSTEYEYEIKVSDGTIVDKSTEQLTAASAATSNSSGSNSGSSGSNSGSNNSGSSSGSNSSGSSSGNSGSASSSSGSNSGNSSSASSNSGSGSASASSSASSSGTTANITLSKAKEIALSDAGVSSGSATFTKAKQDKEDGVSVYDIDFYTTSAEYEYEIRVSDGTIIDKSVEKHETASNSAGSSSGSSNSSSSGSSISSGISVDKAKQIALNKAGLSASEVTFTKAMKEKDDGITVYEIEFYKGAAEYECTINASTGAILEYDVDVDD
ncbi:MAG: PepSY domain-containing protein [Clostridiales bacterium]|nr:PepSY domain-containing protein [Clostridiales bacterium]